MDLTGKRFTRLVALERTRINGVIHWKCKCDCGNETFVKTGNLTKERGTKSCGCLNLERTKEMGRSRRKNTFNLDFFKVWSKDLAYVLGLFASDGHISNQEFRIQLSEKDKDILYKVKDLLSMSNDIKKVMMKSGEKEYPSYLLVISSVDLVKVLNDLGYDNNKTYETKLPKGMPNEYMADFIRGFFDGDGSISGYKLKNSNKPTMQVKLISYSSKILEDMAIWLKENISTKNSNVYQDNRGYSYLSFGLRDSLKIYDLFYKESTTYIERKKAKFDEIIEQRNI